MKKYLPLPLSFYQRPTEEVARDLLGKLVVHRVGSEVLVGKIVETEAYTIDDPACHAYRGKTIANQSLFGPVGHTYVYLSYGIHYCMNIVSRASDCPAGGVLVRALEPLEGLDLMRKHRPGVTDRMLTNGPGKLTQALGITQKFDGHDLASHDLFIAYAPAPEHIVTTTRIGISKGQHAHRRFYIADNPYVSKQ